MDLSLGVTPTLPAEGWLVLNAPVLVLFIPGSWDFAQLSCEAGPGLDMLRYLSPPVICTVQQPGGALQSVSSFDCTI